MNVYTTSTQGFFTTYLDVYVPFLQTYGLQATTLIEVKGLFATLNVALEATVLSKSWESLYLKSRTDGPKCFVKNHNAKQSVWLEFF